MCVACTKHNCSPKAGHNSRPGSPKGMLTTNALVRAQLHSLRMQLIDKAMFQMPKCVFLSATQWQVCKFALHRHTQLLRQCICICMQVCASYFGRSGHLWHSTQIRHWCRLKQWMQVTELCSVRNPCPIILEILAKGYYHLHRQDNPLGQRGRWPTSCSWLSALLPPHHPLLPAVV